MTVETTELRKRYVRSKERYEELLKVMKQLQAIERGARHEYEVLGAELERIEREAGGTGSYGR